MSRSSETKVARLFRRLSSLPGGRQAFAFGVCRRAPYFSTIRPRVESLRAGHAIVSMRRRRTVLNHIGSVHAIAMCNLAELAAGLLAEATVPPTLRWIPKAMSVDYLRKAMTDLTGQARAPAIPPDGAGADWPVDVSIVDGAGETVCRAVITLWVSPARRA